VPPSGTASQKNCPFLLREKIGARKIKKCKGNFSARLRAGARAAGFRLRLAGKNFPPPTPPIFAYEPNKRSKNALWFFGAAGLE